MIMYERPDSNSNQIHVFQNHNEVLMKFLKSISPGIAGQEVPRESTSTIEHQIVSIQKPPTA